MPAADVYWKGSGMQAFLFQHAGSLVLLCTISAAEMCKGRGYKLHACRVADRSLHC